MKQDLFQNLSEEYKILKETQLRLEVYYRKVSTGLATLEDLMHFTMLLGAPMLFVKTHCGKRPCDNVDLLQRLLTEEIDYHLANAKPETITLLSGEALDCIDRLLTTYSKFSFTQRELQYMLKYFSKVYHEFQKDDPPVTYKQIVKEQPTQKSLVWALTPLAASDIH